EDRVVPASTWNRATASSTANDSPTAKEPSQVPTVGGGIQVPKAPLTTSPPAAQSPAPNADPLLAQLHAHGVTWQNAKSDPGGIRLTCIVRDLQHPDIERWYEAIGPDYAAAVRGVLYQIDRAQKGQPRAQ